MRILCCTLCSTLCCAFTLILGVVSASAADNESVPTPLQRPPDPGQKLERTSFQTADHFSPTTQLGSDVAMCYGIDPSIGQRLAEWKSQGYLPEVMTGVAWGNYQDYLYGRFDGKNHVDEAQTDRNGHVIGHGGDVYYMSPGEGYGRYLSQGVKRAIDAGAQAIYLEEPEFWVRAGYSKGFQREWKTYYHEDWIPPHTSPDAQYRASMLKYHLYQRALKQVFDFVKAYNKQTGKHVRCYVPTHSLINYAHWNIVSPESSLMNVGADGYIAQVWTGTARTPNVYEGRERERTFETAFLEYGAMMNVARASGGRVWFLNDPVEDNPDHTWTDYRTNWESTLTASLLWPQVWRFEVMPWPSRVFGGQYPDGTGKRAPIPPDYATELLTVINTLNDMNQPKVEWDCGTRGLGVVVSDSMMFQRGDPTPSDPHLGSFYGLAMPLVKRGIPADPVQLETAALHGALSPYRVLLMTYEGMKPMTPESNAAIARWVRAGGVLVFLGDDSDPYNHVRAWWNTAPLSYQSPRQALFEQLGLPRGAAAGVHRAGKGLLIYDTASPAALTYQADGADHVRNLAQQACKAAGLPYRETSYLAVRRGPYVVAAGMDESLPGEARVLHGHFIDLFDAHLPILESVSLAPGSRFLLLDLDRLSPSHPTVVAAACKVLGEKAGTGDSLTFFAEAPANTTATARIWLPEAPHSVTVDHDPLPADAQTWDPLTKTLLIRFANSATGHWITIG